MHVRAQKHANVVNAARALVYGEEGVSSEDVRVVSAGTLVFQPVTDGWEIVAMVNDSGHFRPKSKFVRHVHFKLSELGHDVLRICDGTSQVLSALAQHEARWEQRIWDPRNENRLAARAGCGVAAAASDRYRLPE